MINRRLFAQTLISIAAVKKMADGESPWAGGRTAGEEKTAAERAVEGQDKQLTLR